MCDVTMTASHIASFKPYVFSVHNATEQVLASGPAYLIKAKNWFLQSQLKDLKSSESLYDCLIIFFVPVVCHQLKIGHCSELLVNLLC